jgi:sensor domain CHASE-containing protein
MTLRKKTLLITGFMIASMVLTVFIITQFVILQSYIKLDNEAANQNTQRAVNALTNRLKNMEKVIIDWAVWDDAYQYASDGNSDFVDSNITVDAFQQLEMNVMLIIDKSGKVLNASGFDIKSGEQVVVPDDVINTLSHDPLLLAVNMDTPIKSGIVDLAGQKMIANTG